MFLSYMTHQSNSSVLKRSKGVCKEDFQAPAPSWANYTGSDTPVPLNPSKNFEREIFMKEKKCTWALMFFLERPWENLCHFGGFTVSPCLIFLMSVSETLLE